MSWAPYQAIDREAIWAALYSAFAAKLTAPFWAASAAVTAGAICVDPQGHLQAALGNGTTGATVPAWNDDGGTTTDGTVTWRDTGQGFVSIGRKHKRPPDLGRMEQPALFVVGVKESREPKPYPGVPNRLTLHGLLILYLSAPVVNEDIGQEQLLAATQMNVLLKAIDTVMLPDDPSGKFTLGGLAAHCWIEGDCVLDPGILGPQAAAMLPVHILVP
jgi:hypothetical protein